MKPFLRETGLSLVKVVMASHLLFQMMCHERGLTRSLQHAIFYQEGNAISQSACKNAQVRAVFEKFSEEVAATSGRNEVEKLAKLLESIFGFTYNQEELGGHLVRKEARQSASSSKSSFGFRS